VLLARRPVWAFSNVSYMPTQSKPRNTFVDAVRAVALVRVVVWHTYGYAWISYLVASMPAMFFIAGSLMAQSLDRGRTLDVLYRRFRRVLIPLWLLAGAAIAVMVAYDAFSPGNDADFDLKGAVWWLVPIWDPTGSEWGMTWWAPLWYLRCLTWLLIASPLLLWAWRRSGPTLLLVPPALLAFMEARIAAGGSVPWQLQDAALYSFFWMLGFAYYEGRLNALTNLGRALLAAAFGGAAAVWALTQDVPGGIVNASYPLHLFVGLAWLFGALAFEGTIAAFARLISVEGAAPTPTPAPGEETRFPGPKPPTDLLESRGQSIRGSASAKARPQYEGF